jgi:ankyrin repeat protein
LVYYHQLGASINALSSNGTGLIHLCIEGNNPKLLVYLLNKGINIDQADKSGTSALLLAAMDSSRLGVLKVLLKRNATLDQRNNRHTSPLTMAIKRYNIKAAILLIKDGADVNIRDGIDSPLSLTHQALVQAINKDLLHELRSLETLLITKGAHVNNSDDTLRWSPLMLTASHYQDGKSLQHLKLLIKLGANIEQADKNKRTALMIAASLGRVEALEYLIRSRAQLDSCDKFGWTALMLAIYYNQKEVVKILLAAGSNVNLITKKGLSAIKVAVDNDRVSLLPILKEYGAVFPKE